MGKVKQFLQRFSKEWTKVMFAPFPFFEGVEAASYLYPLLFATTSFVIAWFLHSLVSLSGGLLTGHLGFYAFSSVIIYGVFCVLGAGLTFFVAFLQWGTAKLLDCHIDTELAYAVVAYSVAPVALRFVPVLGVFLPIYGLALNFIGIRAAYQLSIPKSLLILFLPVIIGLTFGWLFLRSPLGGF